MEADLAVLLDSRIPAPAFFSAAGFRKSFVTVRYEAIPGFPERFPGAVSFGVTEEGKKLVVCHGTLLCSEGRTNAELGHVVRVLQLLLARRLLLVNEVRLFFFFFFSAFFFSSFPSLLFFLFSSFSISLSFLFLFSFFFPSSPPAQVASYTRQAPMDSFVLLRDHFNLAGRNPLFGKNVPEFGIRFADLGNLYTDTMRQSVRRCAQQLDLTIVEATCAFVIGPLFASLADANVITIGCEAQVACTGMIPEVIVARHAGIPLAAIGIVKMFVVPGDVRGSNKFRDRNSRNLVALISNLLHNL